MPRTKKDPPQSKPRRRDAPRPKAQDAPRHSAQSEFDFIAQLRARPSELDARGARGLVRGIGDDAAVFAPTPASELLVTSDLLVEEIDFRLDTFEPSDIGHKAVAASLSDIAAMGGRPRWVLLSIGVPQRLWRKPRFVEDLFDGASSLARLHGAHVVGGDISRTPERVVFDATVIGEAARGRAVYRSGARPGDQIFVTGTLGGAAGALRVFERAQALSKSSRREAETFGREAQTFLSEYSELTRCQTRPMPRVEWGAMLGERGLATAMIDTSDGLSSDLAHLCRESGVGALVEAALLPIDPLLRLSRVARGDDFAPALKRDALKLALHGGEDFELLFTVRPRDARKLPASLEGVAVTRVGEIREARAGVKLLRGRRETDLRPSGFEHFRRAD
ncbi:MAG TPA: thiamine-phosphate kinase [Pyrinomonadaceae bacterium]|nr:thiamine-phosphate kinase [Pyrinomonadaceae bacterium]